MTQALRGYQSQLSQFTLIDQYNEANGATQTAELGIGASWGILGQISGTDSEHVNGIMISLAPSSSGAASSSVMASTSGQMLMSTKYSQYWWLLGAGVQIQPDSASPVTLAVAGPIGTQDMNTVSTSVSIGAGFFGGDPTANGSYSTSFSTSFSDFQVSDLSQLQGSALKTLYYMSSYSDGQFYPDGRNYLTWQENLDPLSPDFLSDLQSRAGGPFRVHQPSYNAWQSSLPLISQGIWVVDQAFTGVTTFSITTYLTFAAWHLNFESAYAAVYPVCQTTSFQVDWSQVPGQGTNPSSSAAAARRR
jgi:hypothetical protein